MLTAVKPPPYKLRAEHFRFALGIAALVHLLLILLWMLNPREAVVDVPVRVLNVKLGEGGEALPTATPKKAPTPPAKPALKPAAPLIKPMMPEPIMPAPPTPKMEALLPKPRPLPPAPKAPEKSKSQEAVEKMQAQQFVREQPFDYRPVAGSANAGAGNPALSPAARYEQLISSWIEKFKQYPPEARAQGLRGVPIVRVRVDRRGNVRFVGLDVSTGHQVLDRAAIAMINNANPLPPAPPEYKAEQELLEFKIPVRFNL